MIASHYAEPLPCSLIRDVTLLATAGGDQIVKELRAGERFELLDNSLGWAWGYAGEDRRVGYIPADALA